MKIILVAYILFILFSVYLFQSELPILYPTTSHALVSDENHERYDKFGIREIYPTKVNGREWYVNMENPKNDESFAVTFNPNLTRQEDGSWRVSVPVVRMNVKTL